MTVKSIRPKPWEIRAILREIEAPGTGKTQTRRMLKPQPFIDANGNFCCADRNGKLWNWGQHIDGRPCTRNFVEEKCVNIGDLLWVREAWRTASAYDDLAPADMGGEEPLRFEAERAVVTHGWPSPDKWGRYRHSMFMPRWASRLTLEVTGVKVERLHDISEADALAEGVILQNVITDVRCYGGHPIEITADRYWNGTELDEFEGFESATEAYAALRDTINGTGAWDANPWVAAITFRPHLCNIDAFMKERAP